MNRAEIESWIADDPDPKTAAELQLLLDKNDAATLDRLFNGFLTFGTAGLDRKSTRLNSSHIPLSRMPSSA